MRRLNLTILMLVLSNVHAGPLSCVTWDPSTFTFPEGRLLTDFCGISGNYGIINSTDQGCAKKYSSTVRAGLRVIGPAGAGSVWEVTAPADLTVMGISSASSNNKFPMALSSCIVESDNAIYCSYTTTKTIQGTYRHWIVMNPGAVVKVNGRLPDNSQYRLMGMVSALGGHPLRSGLGQEITSKTAIGVQSSFKVDVDEAQSIDVDRGTTVTHKISGVAGTSGLHPVAGRVKYKVRPSSDGGPAVAFAGGGDEIVTGSDFPTLVVTPGASPVGSYARYIDATITCP